MKLLQPEVINPPRLTTAQKNAISNPVAGLIVYDTTIACLSEFDGSHWNNKVSGFGVRTIVVGSPSDWSTYNPSPQTGDLFIDTTA